MSDSAYSPLKAVRHLDIVQDTRARKPSRPAHVQLILSDLCNQACGFCAYRDPSYSSSQMFFEIKPTGAGLRKDKEHPERNYNPNRMIPTEKALEILDDCSLMGVSGIQFTGGGEPTVHPDFADILDFAQAGDTVKTSLVTNGVLVGKKFEEWREQLMKLAWIRFSLDAAKPETYCSIRNVPAWHFTSALSGIRELRRARDEAGRGPVIGVGFVVTPDNWREVYDACQIAKDSGADNIRISAQFSADDENRFEDFHTECAYLCKTAEALSDESFTAVNRFSQKLDDLKQKAPDYELCSYQLFTTYIGADLNVYRCCSTSYNQHGLVGSIKDQRFKNLWMSQSRVDEMLRFKASSCDRCQFNTIQRITNYLVQPDDPEHSAFV